VWCSTKSNSIWRWGSCCLHEFSLSNNYMFSLRTTTCDALIVPSDYTQWRCRSLQLLFSLVVWRTKSISVFVNMYFLVTNVCMSSKPILWYLNMFSIGWHSFKCCINLLTRENRRNSVVFWLIKCNRAIHNLYGLKLFTYLRLKIPFVIK